MGKRRKRTTWRLTADNFDWLYKHMKRKGRDSMNAELNEKLAELRESEQSEAVKWLSHPSNAKQ